MKNDKYNPDRGIVLIIIIVLFITFILVLLDMINITKYIKLSSQYDWLSYIGSILGGLLTLVGVILTIKFEKRLRKEELCIAYKPIILPSGENANDIDGYRISIDVMQKGIDKGELAPQIPIVFKNKGRGETKKLLINSIKFKNEDGIDFVLKKELLKRTIYVESILSDNYFIIYISFPEVIYTDSRKIIDNDILIEFSLKYSDLFEYKNYNDKYQLSISIKEIGDKTNRRKINQRYYYGHIVSYSKTNLIGKIINTNK